MIYFDNAATTLQKPPRVAEAMRRAVSAAAGPGRGAHDSAMRAARILFDGRELLAEFFGLSNPEAIVFTHNATHALNIAVQSLLPAEGTVLHSSYEHNATMRQLYAAKGVTLHAVDRPLYQPAQTLENWRAALEQPVTLAVLCHASNVFGSLAPAEEIAALCAEKGVPLVLDAAQSCGHVPINSTKLPNTLICTAGHKGLYGPQGTGVLVVPETMSLQPLLRGGTGSRSRRREMPDDLPERLEAGTQNVPGVAGLIEGVSFVKQKGFTAIKAHERKLLTLMVKELSTLPGVYTYHAEDLKNQLGVLSFTVENHDCEDIAAALSRYDIAVRAGLHCAPLAHESAGTVEQGTVRVSFSLYNTEQQVREFVRRLRVIVG